MICVNEKFGHCLAKSIKEANRWFQFNQTDYRFIDDIENYSFIGRQRNPVTSNNLQLSQQPKAVTKDDEINFDHLTIIYTEQSFIQLINFDSLPQNTLNINVYPKDLVKRVI